MPQFISALFRHDARYGDEGKNNQVSNSSRRRVEPAKGRLRKNDRNATCTNHPYKAAFRNLPPSQWHFESEPLPWPDATSRAPDFVSLPVHEIGSSTVPAFLIRSDCSQPDNNRILKRPFQPSAILQPAELGSHEIRRKPVATPGLKDSGSTGSYSTTSGRNVIQKEDCQYFGKGKSRANSSSEQLYRFDAPFAGFWGPIREVDEYRPSRRGPCTQHLEVLPRDDQNRDHQIPALEQVLNEQLEWWERKGEEELELGGWEHLSEEEELSIDRQYHEEAMLAAQLEREQQRERERQREKELQLEHQRTLDEAVAAMIVFEQELARELERQREILARRECVCCGDAKATKAFPSHPPTYSCEHDSQTCQECLSTWLNTELSSKGSPDLKCPECPQLLTHADVQRCASEQTFLAYDKLLTRNTLSSLPNFAWCLNPTGCSSGQENTSPSTAYMRCNACNYAQCLRHKCAWHKNETCEQYEHRKSGQKAREEEAATEKMLDSMSKKCPGPKCGWRIQKTSGCDHMTCRKCKWEFCWQCLASQGEIRKLGNTAHLKWCKFHSENLEASWPFNVH